MLAFTCNFIGYGSFDFNLYAIVWDVIILHLAWLYMMNILIICNHLKVVDAWSFIYQSRGLEFPGFGLLLPGSGFLLPGSGFEMFFPDSEFFAYDLVWDAPKSASRFEIILDSKLLDSRFLILDLGFDSRSRSLDSRSRLWDVFSWLWIFYLRLGLGCSKICFQVWDSFRF